jgi:hypothetical protein
MSSSAQLNAGFVANHLYKVDNLSPDLPLTLGWNSQYVTIQAGQSGFAPVDAVSIKYGDPRSGLDRQVVKENGVSMIIPARKEELARLGCLYAAGSFWDARKEEHVVKSEPDADLIKASPTYVPVRCQTLDGDDVILPIDDPDCNSMIPQIDGMDQAEQLRQELAQMKRRQAVLERMLTQKDIPQAASDIPVDNPPAARSAAVPRSSIPPRGKAI